jgi:hypothetical protein
MILAEPAHTGVTGQHLGERFLMTVIDYPAAGESPGSQLAPGPFPLLMFAPGFLQRHRTGPQDRAAVRPRRQRRRTAGQGHQPGIETG